MSHFQAFHSQKLKFKLPLSLHLHKKQDEGGKFSLRYVNFHLWHVNFRRHHLLEYGRLWDYAFLQTLTECLNVQLVRYGGSRLSASSCTLSEAILEGQWHWKSPLTQHHFLSGVGRFAYNTFHARWVFSACLEVLWRLQVMNILYQSIEGQTHLVCQEALKWLWPSMNQNRLLFIQNSNTAPEHAPLVGRNHWYYKQNNQMKIIGDQLPTKHPIELKDNFS